MSIAALHYDGTFGLEFLTDGEEVRSAGDATGACEIVTPKGNTRVEVGDWIIRGVRGDLHIVRMRRLAGRVRSFLTKGRA